MPTSYEDKIKQQAEQYLEPGERVLAAFIAQPRGANMAQGRRPRAGRRRWAQDEGGKGARPRRAG